MSLTPVTPKHAATGVQAMHSAAAIRDDLVRRASTTVQIVTAQRFL
jgi:hypothetical protein